MSETPKSKTNTAAEAEADSTVSSPGIPAASAPPENNEAFAEPRDSAGESQAAKKKTNKKKKAKNTPTLIVGIGASAGGLSALQTFFSSIPPHTGMSFVLIQHLSPDYKSMMGEILQKNSTLKIQTIKRSAKLKPNHLYLMPNNKNLVIQENSVNTVGKPTGKQINMPVDLFFDSLGKEYSVQAVGIILSGTGTDGSRGIKTLKEYGGMVFCQSPESSEFDGMPNASLELGLVDYSGSPEELARKLVNINKNISRGSEHNFNQHVQAAQNEYFTKILKKTSEATGVDFEKAYRKTTLKRRVEKRLRVNFLNSMKDYYQYILERPEETDLLKQEFYIGVTHFFRDRKAWQSLEALLLAHHRKAPQKHYRIWVAGCSTGEEAYSVAMVMEQLQKLNPAPFDYKIFATDLDKVALQRASLGVYNQGAVYEIPLQYLTHAFVRGKNDTYRIKKHLREKIVFSQHDLLTDPPFMHVDLLICRNLLIYFEPEYQNKIAAHIKFALNEGSFLFLGPSETLGAQHVKDFEPLDARWNIFQLSHKSKQGMLLNPSNITPKNSVVTKVFQQSDPVIFHSEPQQRSARSHRSVAFEDLINEHFSFAVLFLDREGRIVFSKGPVEDYIQFPGPEMSFFDCLPRRASALVRGAIRSVFKDKKDVAFTPLEYKRKREKIQVQLSISLVEDDAFEQELVLLQFSRFTALTASEEGEVLTRNINAQGNLDQIHLLEDELAETQIRLNNTVRDLEITNEALQTSNEELLSSNEELQSSNEELQSVNEELHTVNDEFQNKIEELRQVNNDIDNLIRSTNIGTIFLDRNFCIRKTTPAITSLFPINEQDVGRPFNNFTHKFVELSEAELFALVKKVYNTLNSYEQEVSISSGQSLLMKIQPFRTGGDSVEGVVLTFVDLSELKEVERERQEAEHLFQAAFESAAIANVLFHPEGQIQRVNQTLCSMLDRNEEELLEEQIYDLLPIEQNAEFQALLNREITHYRFEGVYAQHETGPRWGLFYLAAIEAQEGEVQNLVLQIQDISDMRQHEQNYILMNEKLSETNALLDASFRNAQIGMQLFEPQNGQIVAVNPAFCKILGYSAAELLKMSTFDLHPENEQDVIREKVEAMCNGDIKSFLLEQRYLHKKGHLIWCQKHGALVHHENGEIRYIIGQLQDITERKQMQRKLLAEQHRSQKAEALAHVGSWELNLKTNETEWSDEFYRICGLEPQMVKATVELGMKLIHPDDQPKAQAALQSAIESCGNYSVEKRIVRPDGTIRHVLSQGTISQDEEGQPHMLVGSFLDMTQIKEQEQLLKETNYLLVRQNQQLESFTHISSHNLRAPIANMISLSELLQQTEDPAKRENLIQMLSRSAKGALTTLDDIGMALKVSKDIHQDLVPMRFEDILNKTLMILKGEIRKTEAAIKSDFSACEVIEYPRIYLESIFLNLLSNALKYTSPQRKPEISVQSYCEGGNIRLEVCDNGLGINLDKHRDKVFGLYKTFHRHEDSRGVGLFMTKTQVEAMGGSIEVQSKVGQGTCFIVHFAPQTLDDET